MPKSSEPKELTIRCATRHLRNFLADCGSNMDADDEVGESASIDDARETPLDERGLFHGL